MKLITPIALIAILLITHTMPDSSVGGPLTLMLAFVLAALAVGLHEAWTRQRSALGWIVSIVAAVVGGFSGVALGGFAFEGILPSLNLEGSLASTRHHMLHVSSAGMMVLTLLGAWIALWIVNRLR